MNAVARAFSCFICLVIVLVGGGCATRAPRAVAAPVPVDASKGTPGADGITWFSALDVGLEGQGWHNVKHPYDRLPAEAEGAVPEPVWSLSRDSSGLAAHFVTDSPTIRARWSLLKGNLAMPHMPATGVSGLDLYVKVNGAWGWVGVGRPGQVKGNEAALVTGAPKGLHEYMLYLPLYNGTDSLDIGVATGSVLGKAPAYPDAKKKPVLVWGTSIVQGGCASRPGMAYPAILGRRLGRPMINLGFSGNGRMDPGVTALIARLDMAAYVIDCAPNMDPALITERTEPLIHALRAAHPATPIVVVENVPYQQGWFIQSSKDAYVNKNAALKAAYDKLVAGGVKELYYVPCTNLYGHDHEATVDGTHATDLGFMRMADTIEPVLRRALK